MEYDRRDPIMREQYNTLIGCLKCEGENTCDRYIIPVESKNLVCGWYRTILSDKKKLLTKKKEIEKGEVFLTLPLLEKILEDLISIEKVPEKILDKIVSLESELPAHNGGLYVQGCNYMKT